MNGQLTLLAASLHCLPGPPALQLKAVLFAALYPNVAVMDDEAAPGGLHAWFATADQG